MGLVLPSFYFSNEVDNLTGTVSGAPGTVVTSSATANNDGTAVTLLSALGFDVVYLAIRAGSTAARSAKNPCCNLDILIDPAGGTSWASFIDNLLIPGWLPYNALPYPMDYAFPIFIKSGTSIGARVRTPNTGALSYSVMIWAYGIPNRPELWWCGSTVETLGATTASSRGTNVTPGTSGSYGSWTDIGTTTADYGSICPGYCGENATTMQIQYNYLRLGYSSTQLPGSPVYWVGGTTEENGTLMMNSVPLWCDIPSGTVMQVQIASHLASAPDVLQIALYGVY